MRTSGVYKLRYLIQANWTSQLAYRYKLPFCYRLPFRYPIPSEKTNFTNTSVTHNPKHPNRVMARVPQTKCQINKLTSVLYSFSDRMHVSLACYHLLRGIWLCQIGCKRSISWQYIETQIIYLCNQDIHCTKWKLLLDHTEKLKMKV